MNKYHIIASKNFEEFTIAKFDNYKDAEEFLLSIKGVYNNLLYMDLRIEEVK